MLYKNYCIDNYVEDIILTCLYDENRLDGLLIFRFFLDKYTPRGLGKAGRHGRTRAGLCSSLLALFWP